MLGERARKLRAMHAERVGRRGHRSVRLHRGHDAVFAQNNAGIPPRTFRGRAACAAYAGSACSASSAARGARVHATRAGVGHRAMAPPLPKADGQLRTGSMPRTSITSIFGS